MNGAVGATTARSTAASAYDDPRGLLEIGPALERQLVAQGRVLDAAQMARSLALAALTCRDVAAAAAHLARVHQHVPDANAEVVLEARVTEAAVLASRGRFAAAIQLLDEVGARAGPAVARRALTQRAAVVYRQGQAVEAASLLDVAEEGLRRSGDRDWVVSALVTRSHLAGDTGDHDLSAGYLTEALALTEEAGQHARTALILHSLGWVTARRGDVPGALRALERAAAIRHDLRLPTAFVELERGIVLRSAGMHAEALAQVQASIDALERSGTALSLGEALIELAATAALAGHADHAIAAAQRAREVLVDQGRPALARRADVAGMRAHLVGTRAVSAELVRAAVDLADAVQGESDLHTTIAARLVSAEMALRAGLVDVAAVQVSHVAPGAELPPDLAARHAFVQAQVARASGDPAQARRSVDAGIRAVGAYRNMVGDVELHAHGAAHAEDLYALVFELDVEAGDAVALRARALDQRRQVGVLPTPDPEDRRRVDGALTALRSVSVAASRGDRAADARRRDLEDLLRRGAATAPGRPGRPPEAAVAVAPPDVTYVEVGSRLWGVFDGGDGTAHLVDLADVHAVRTQVTSLRFSQMRIAREVGAGRSSGPRATAARRDGSEAAHWLRTNLLPDAYVLAGTDPLRVSPSALLHPLPWGAVVDTRAVQVVVPATTPVRDGGRGPVFVGSGPGLAAAAEEVEAVAAEHPEAIARPMATAEQVLEAMGSADVVHLACHGAFRTDNPMFSSLTFADGPVFVHDLVRAGRMPRTVVLSACDAGNAAVVAEGAYLGTASALVAGGADHVIAALLPVPDTLALTFARSFHAAFASGADPGSATAQAQAVLDPVFRPFVCLSRCEPER